MRLMQNRRALAALISASSASLAFAAGPRVDRGAFDPIDVREGIVRSWDVVNVGDGLWTDPGNWVPAGAPQNGDLARLFQGDATNRTVTYNDSSGLTLDSLRIDATGNGQMTLQHNQFSLTTAELVVGIMGKGQYNLAGGTLNSFIGYVGAINNGVFNQSGGRHVSGSFLSMGNNAGARGTYNMSGGSLSSSELDVGYFGSGTFFQTNGAVAVGSHYGIGYADTGIGNYIQTGGSVLAQSGYVGLFGVGTYMQAGGTHTVLSTLSVGENDIARGTYAMGGGTLTAGEFNIGYEGQGTLVMDGGTVNAGSLYFAAQPNSRGNGTLTNGVINVSGEAIIGSGTNSIASFNHNSGMLAVTGDLSVGFNQGASATYVLGGGTVSSNKLKVGYIGNGTFTQIVGRNTVTTYLSIADQAASTSTYSMRGGQLDVGELEVGYRGNGSMFHDGGTVNVASFTAVGFVTGARGNYNMLPGGTLNSPSTYVGLFGTGTFTQTGGVHNAPNVLSVGENPGSAGTYNIGSTAQLNTGEFDVGFQGTGVVNQNGGTVNANELDVAASIGGVGSYFMSEGTLSVSANEFIAFTTSTSGTFSQSGGLHTVNGAISMAVQGGTTAVFELNGGRLNAGSMNIGGSAGGAGGVATYTQGGGILNVANRVRVYGGSTLSLNAGSFSVGELNTNNGGYVRLGPGADLTPRVRSLQGQSGVIDVTDNGLIVDYTGPSPMGKPLGPFGSVANLIANGWAGGTWQGLGIRTSLGNASVFALGYGEASRILGISGAQTGTFRGETVDATSVLVVFTYYGDATLDRRVDINDFAQLGANFNMTGKVWQDGDFNYDEVVNIGDFALLAANYNLAFPGARNANQPDALGIGDFSMLAANFNAANSAGPRAGAVPEPATLGLLALTGLAARRRRR